MIARFPRSLFRASAVLLVSTFAAGAGGAGNAAEGTGKPARRVPERLAEERWREGSHGLSLRPPKAAKRRTGGPEGTLVRFHLPEGGHIGVRLNHAGQQISLDDIRESSVRQLALASPNAQIRAERGLRVRGLEGAVIYFELPPDEERPEARLLGRAFLPIGEQRFVVLRLSAPASRYEQLRPVFEAMFRSLQWRDPKELDAHREERVENGEKALAQVGPSRWDEVLSGEDRWFRVLDTEREQAIGYRRVRERTTELLGRSGVQVIVQSRIVGEKHVRDRLQRFFRAHGGGHEIWSIRVTVRPRGGGDKASRALTGVRDRGRIHVTRQTPTGKKHHRWQVPSAGYLSPVVAHLLPRRFAREGAPGGEMGFYTYMPRKNELTFRTYRVERTDNGGWRIDERRAPELAPRVERRGPEGTVQRVTLPDDRALVPAKRSALAKEWEMPGQ